MTLVSIVTPSYNQAQFLEQAMHSVLDQDHPDIQYIVMDGGSTDGSLEIIQRYADRLSFWSSEKDRGQADAINKGFAHAAGDVVAWLNSDDYYLPGAISAAVKALEADPGLSIVYADMLAVNEQGEVINHFKYSQLALEDLLCFQIIGQPSVFMRHSALQAAGGLDTDYHFLLDHQLWMKIASLGPIRHCDQTWAAARYHAAAKNRRMALGFGPEAFRLLDWAATTPELSRALSTVRTRAHASAYRLDSRYKLDAGYAAASLAAWFRAFRLHPGTALARVNIPASAFLELSGLAFLRRAFLRWRQRSLGDPGSR